MTYGIGGAERERAFFVGETVSLATTTRGLKSGEDGKTRFQINVSLFDAKNKLIGTVPTSNFKAKLCLGGDVARTISFFTIADGNPPGEYIARVRVTDEIDKRETSEELSLRIIEASSLGAMNLRLSRDPKGVIPSYSVFPVGETAFLHFAVTGLDEVDNRMRAKVACSIVDSDGKPVFSLNEETIDHSSDHVKANGGYVDQFYFAYANASGTYSFHVKIEDLNSSDVVEYDVPFTTVDMAAPELTSSSRGKVVK